MKASHLAWLACQVVSPERPSRPGPVSPPGADVQKGRGLDSPLHAAAQTGHAPITGLLLEFGADVHARNAEVQRAVELATPGGSTETLLLAHEGTGGLVG